MRMSSLRRLSRVSGGLDFGLSLWGRITLYISIHYQGIVHLSVNVDSVLKNALNYNKCNKKTFAEISGSFFLTQKLLALDFFPLWHHKKLLFFFQGESLIYSNQTGFSGIDSLWNCRAEENRLCAVIQAQYWLLKMAVLSWAKQPLAFSSKHFVCLVLFFVFISRGSITKCHTFISIRGRIAAHQWGELPEVLSWKCGWLVLYKCLTLVLFLWTFS